MADFPAHCSHCGFLFSVSGLFGGNFPSINMHGNTTNCPNCGNWARMADGNFRINNDELSLLSGPPFTWDMMDRLKKVIDFAKEKQSSTTALLTEVAQISPQLAEKLEQHNKYPVFVIILVLIWLIKAVEVNLDLDINKLIDQAWHISQNQDPDAHASPNNDEFPIPSDSIIKPENIDKPRIANNDTNALSSTKPTNRHERRREKSLAKKSVRNA